jgi:hypothetical protein
MIKLLLVIGFVAKRSDGSISWPFHAPPMWVFIHMLKHERMPYRFKNLPGVRKYIPGRMLPRRWGGGWLGFEFGDRGH